MNMLMSAPIFAAGLMLAAPAIAQMQDHAPVDLPGASHLTQDAVGKEAWTYVNPAANFLKYRTLIIEPTTVYDGPDAQFGDIDLADRAAYAQIMTDALQAELGQEFPPPPGRPTNTLRVQVTLLGAEKTIRGLATATRITPIGFGLAAAKSLMGKQGTFTGSVLFAVEARDATTGELLLAAVRRRTPDPLDIPATLSTTDTVKAVARDFAASARKRLEGMTGVPATP